MTISQLLILNVEMGRLSLVREKQAVNAMTVALTSLFESKISQTYNREIDKALAATDVLGTSRESNGKRRPVASSGQHSRSKQRATDHTMRELSKLNSLFGG